MSLLNLAKRLQKVATSVSEVKAQKLAAAIAKHAAKSQSDEKVRSEHASNFNKTKRMDYPVITWNSFEKESKQQLLFRVYARDNERDKKTVQALVQSVKDAMSRSKVAFEYEDDLSEPGLIVKTISGLCSK